MDQEAALSVLRLEEGFVKTKLINGKPVSCRTCLFVMDSRFRWTCGVNHGAATENFCDVTCCRTAPPAMFRWQQPQFEPFCGQYQFDETPIVQEPPLTMPPSVVRDRVREVFPDAIPIYGVEVPADKLSDELRRAVFPRKDAR